MMAGPVLFLDIDGVMIAYPEGEPTPPAFTPRCVEALRGVLVELPELRIVFSTTWRRPEHVNRLHEQWISHGLPPNLAIDGTPDLRENKSVSRLRLRGREIESWLTVHPEITRWAVLDDDRMSIEGILDPNRCVFTDPQRGMTARDAEKLVRIFRSTCA